MKRFISVALILMMIATFVTGCQQAPKQGAETPKESQQAVDTPKDNEGPTTIVDPAGNEIIIPENIKSIVSMAPSITEVLVELGFKDKIVAVDNNSLSLEGIPEDIPHIDMMAPDVEELITLNPDLILASSISMGGGEDPLAQLKEEGITIAYIPSSNSIEGVYSDIIFISKVLDVEDKGQDIVNNMKEKIDDIKKIGDTITDKKSVYFEIGAAPDLYSFGNGVFLNEMIELIGATNILADQESWIGVSEEAVISANPDVIITNVNYIENATEEIKSRDGWENINAIKNDEVYYVDNMASSLPNHNIIKALDEMAKAVYPDKY